MAPTYTPGSTVTITAQFTAKGVPADPGSVVVSYKTPAGTLTTKTYVTDPEVVRDAQGHYHCDIPIPAGSTSSGQWSWRVAGTSPVQAAKEGVFTVTTTSF